MIFLSVLATVTKGDPQRLPGSTQQLPLSKESRHQVLLSLHSTTTLLLVSTWDLGWPWLSDRETESRR